MFTVRPLSRLTKPEHIFRVYLSVPALLSLKLRNGDLCQLQLDGDTILRYAIAWTSPEKIQDTIVQTSKIIQELYGLKLGDKLIISRTDETLQVASAVTLLDVTEGVPALTEDDEEHWAWFAGRTLPSQNEVLLVSQVVSVDLVPGERREFRVEGSETTSKCPLAQISRETRFTMSRVHHEASTLRIPSGSVGGLQDQIDQIQKMIWLIAGNLKHALPSFYRPSQGIILYGAKGTGKTLLTGQITKSGWKRVIRWHVDRVMPIVSASDQPCLIIVEGVERSSDGEKSKSTASVQALFESVQGLPVLILAEIRHPNNVSESLRTVGLFAKEIELPIPSQKDRLQILRAIRDGSDQPEDQWIQEAASKTHGYVGSDLAFLLETATQVAFYRRSAMQGRYEPESSTIPDLPPPYFNASDLQQALSLIRPSALQEVFLETPNVRWSDIGGQHTIKAKLRQAVEWPLHQAERMQSLNLRPKKGILLYGPPGCSKTLLVKALAREAELNFLAVKGAELISMYVGESERAVREVFRKARAAAPSIVFFDEIDSIASRGKTELNVLTTLLNEMDGFEELRGVFVVAATNKPMSIDSALMRPGRLDNVVYVGPPDEETRMEILSGWFKKSRVEAVAEKVVERTAGFSGAEIVGICQTAGEFAMQDDRAVITGDDFERAIKETPKGITKEMLREFEAWTAERT